jgi:thiamine biosynthesis protein ThiS
LRHGIRTSEEEKMRALIGSADCEIPPGALLSDLVNVYEKKLADEPMIRSIKKKTGKSLLVFVVNGTVIRPERFDKIRLQAGDDVRIIHPVSGG